MKFNDKFFQRIIYVGILLILASIVLILLNPSFLFGYIFYIFLGTFLIIAGLMGKLYHKGLYKKQIRIIRRIFIACFVIAILSFFVMEGIIFSSAKLEYKQDVQYMIILGAGLKGELPRATLKNRLDTGITYLKINPNIKVIVSGGKGPGEAISEAEGMRRYLIENGIGKDRIIKEDKSTSTYENIIFSKRILNPLGDMHDKEILVVTSNFHLFRAKLFAREAGLIPYGIPAKTPYHLLPIYSIREMLAIMKAYVFGY